MVKNKNLGIQILRFFLSFWVVLVHCSKIRKEHKKILLGKPLHVPTFIFLSFYFFYNIIITRNINRIIQRFQRLLFPFIIWPLIFFTINNTFYLIFRFSQYQKILYINDLYVQLITGNGYHTIFWFHFNLMIVTLIFTIISLIFYNNFMFILHILGLICFYLHYSQINYNFFIRYKYVISHTLGTLIEVIPIALIGFFFSSFNLINRLNKAKRRYIIFNIVVLLYFFKFNIFNTLLGIRYPLMMQNLFGTIISFILFSSIRLENFENLNVIHLIKALTNYTGGIYYLHPFIRLSLNKIFLFIKHRTYAGSFIIYICCYIICFIGIKLTGATKFKNLFF